MVLVDQVIHGKEIYLATSNGEDCFITFKDSSEAEVYSMGIDDSSNRFVLRGSAALSTSNFVMDYSTGNFGFGGDVVTSARVAVTSTTMGFLPPRMTTAQRDAISAPAAGLMIYNTTTNKLNVYTTTWEAVTSA